MAQEVVYTSQEVHNAVNILNEAYTTMNTSIANSINSDFTVLTDLDLFSSGLAKIKEQVKSLAQIYETLIAKLKAHDTTMEETEQTMNTYVDDYTSSSRKSGSSYHRSHGDSSSIEAEAPTTVEENDGKKISNDELQTIIENLDYSNLKVALQNILNSNENLTAMLSDNFNANILTYMLKSMLGGEVDLSKIATEEETLIQKKLLDQLASQNNNVFASLDESTYLAAMPYLKEIAKDNNIEFSSLILDKKNEDKLLGALKSVYDGNVSSLNDNEIGSVRNYLDKIANDNSISIDELLASTKYMSLIKGGVSA